MKDSKVSGSKVPGTSRVLCVLAVVCFGLVAAHSQSTSQDYPTPAKANEISGSIKARDVGDARLTAYYYIFEGGQGDLFVNLVTRNFTGDIDIFAQPGLRPLTKIVVYADLAEVETGRVLYFRKPEKLLLRVQGRSPNDDPAEFRIKFAGSFIAANDPGPAEPELPKVTAANTSGIRVNSVGTILEAVPKPTPSEVVAELEEAKNPVTDLEKKPEAVAEKDKDPAANEPAVSDPARNVEVVVTDPLPKESAAVPVRTPPAARRTRASRLREARAAAAAARAKEKAAAMEGEAVAEESSPKAKAAKTPDPLASIHLVILFKDGKTITQPMNEVFRFSVDKGILTVTMKDGRIGRYSILDVAKVTIE